MTLQVSTINFDDHIDMLNSINDSADRIDQLKKIIREAAYARYYFEVMTNDVWPSFDLKQVQFKNHDYHYSLAGSRLLNKHTVAVLQQVILAEKPTTHTKLYQLKSMLEMLSKKESDILLAVLFKDVSMISDKLTHDEITTALAQ
jgi:hypothetical protein